jgi:Zn-dependent protease with chaperone function
VIVLAIIAIVEALIQGFAYRLASKTDLSTMGFRPRVRPLVIVILIVELLIASLSVLNTPILNTMQRAFESRADCYAATAGYPIGSALLRISGGAHAGIEQSTLYEVFYHDHPVLSRRLQNIQQCRAE